MHDVHLCNSWRMQHLRTGVYEHATSSLYIFQAGSSWLDVFGAVAYPGNHVVSIPDT